MNDVKKKITTEELARMIANGFKNMVTKQDLENSLSGLKTELTSEMQNMEDRLSQKIDGLANRVEKNEDDIRVVKTRIRVS